MGHHTHLHHVAFISEMRDDLMVNRGDEVMAFFRAEIIDGDGQVMGVWFYESESIDRVKEHAVDQHFSLFEDVDRTTATVTWEVEVNDFAEARVVEFMNETPTKIVVDQIEPIRC